ncbi:hypothetical protein BV25DRAFT_1817434 [Artomyces pyxidatus]|uniref:Uncharacterized protein n=1 Tax=Artomyces pyxidatus TaxID=48021 RepID=A0ACB8TJD9_9AGAM|nr:hypothetical protein BV25DRAFT_1817434 [Artomyces pyxidatus]
MGLTFESLPVELVTGIMEELDLTSLVTVAYLSRRLHDIASDPSLNPWRPPILRNLTTGEYEDCLKHLSVRSIVPRQNWIEILSIARPAFLLFEATLPNLKESEWQECFKRRFLPGWQKWKRDLSWREVFKRLLFRAWHRSQTTCTTDESWTKYLVLNRNGSANELEATSRNFNPLAIFNDMKLQSNLHHLDTRVRLVVQLADIRIIALGVLNNPRGAFTVNKNARTFLHPPGIENTSDAIHEGQSIRSTHSDDSGESSSSGGAFNSAPFSPHPTAPLYERLVHPLPSNSHANYPFFTPGGGDKRWFGFGALEEDGQQWVGGMMLTAQITGPQTAVRWMDSPPLQDLDLVLGFGRSQYSSLTWADLAAIAPWMEERITKKIDGPGLGN